MEQSGKNVLDLGTELWPGKRGEAMGRSGCTLRQTRPRCDRRLISWRAEPSHAEITLGLFCMQEGTGVLI